MQIAAVDILFILWHEVCEGSSFKLKLRLEHE